MKVLRVAVSKLLEVKTEKSEGSRVPKLSHLNLLPQGQPERTQRVLRMVQAMDHEGFGNCTMHRECDAVCQKEISVNFIARMNREYLVTSLRD